jgi:hypothetical protein
MSNRSHAVVIRETEEKKLGTDRREVK